jgi:AAA ATPase domain
MVGDAFELIDLGEQDLKGIAEPVHVWRVERASITDSRFDARYGVGGLTPLVGREDEVGLLLRRWSLTRDGEGQVVLLSGEPGIGKSRILSTLRERSEVEGVQALRFQCSPYYVNPRAVRGHRMPSSLRMWAYRAGSARRRSIIIVRNAPRPATGWRAAAEGIAEVIRRCIDQ